MNGFSAIFITSLIAPTLANNLTFVSILYRHGDRAPSLIYPTDPHSPTIWSNGVGELTNSGKNQTYELGKFIRNRYFNFLPSTYHAEDIRVLSSDVDRTIMSAYCVLTGLYEPVDTDVWSHESLKWQPIPVHSIPQILDNLILNYYLPCPKWQQLLSNTVFVPNLKLLEKYQGIIREVVENAGITMPNDTNEALHLASSIYDCLLIEERYGLQLPKWTEKYYPEPLKEITKFLVAMNAYDVPMRRLRCGPLLKDIIERMEDVVEGKSKVKMWQYSSHDTTVIDLLQCLRVFDGDLVPLAGAVFFELHKAERGFEVVIDYKKGEEVKNLKIPGCDIHCPFDFFKKLMGEVLPEDWENECKL